MSEIRLEPLGGGFGVYVSDDHHFSTDTILLADFSKPSGKIKCAELGAGCGTISLLWLKHNPQITVDAVELQCEACELAEKSVRYNKLENRLSVINSDLRELKGRLPFGCYSLVACNPPYKLDGSGIRNPESARLIARHEVGCDFDDICESASRLLQFGGRFCVCQRPERLADVTESMRKFSIEPKVLRLVQQRRQKAPKLFLLEGRKGGKRGFLNVLPTLFIENGSGDFSDEMMEIYGDYKSDHLKG